MTTEERYYTTKLYLDKLACGTDPFSGEELPEDTVLNNIYLCRAFTFASSVLDEVIRNGYRVGKPKSQVNFMITDEQKAKVVLSENAVTVSVITGRVNKVLDEGIKRLVAIHVTGWLEAQGLLVTTKKDDKNVRVATEEGILLGIETIEDDFQGRKIYKNLYSINAQAFIVANLMEIAEFAKNGIKYGDDKEIVEEKVEEEKEKPKKAKKSTKSKKDA